MHRLDNNLGRKLGLLALIASLLLACTPAQKFQGLNQSQSPKVQAPSASAASTAPVHQISQQINKYTGQNGLSPRMQRMVHQARQIMAEPQFEQAMMQGQNSFSLVNNRFSIESNRITDNKMYAVGGRGFDTTNLMDRIYQYDPTAHTLTEVGQTDLDNGTQVASAAVAKHPTTGQVYYLESYQNNRSLFRFDPTNGTRTLIGPTNLTTTVQMAFNREEELYALDGNLNLYRLDTNTAATTLIPLTSADGQGLGGGSGDIAFYGDSGYIYRVDGSGALFQIDLGNSTTRKLGNISGLPFGNTVAGAGFAPDGSFVVLSVDLNNSQTYFFTVDMNTLAATQVALFDSGSTPSDTFPVADLSSSQMYTCPPVSQGRPTVPTMLFSDDFSSFYGSLPNFGNLQGESNPDTVSKWKQWNGDYYPTPNGVTLWNPGPYDPSPGGIDDPSNDIYGVRNTPGEYGPGGTYENPSDPRPHLLETAIARRQTLRYDLGDKVKAKLHFGHTFDHANSDVTLMLCFDDPAETMAVSSTIRGPKTKGDELFVETEIPSCATEVTVIALGYLGEQEGGSVTFEDASLEFQPANYYTETSLLNESFDSDTTHPIYGPFFPTNMDDQFGPYDLVTTDNWPTSPGDKAVTANNPPNPGTQEYGGLVKQVSLGTYDPSDTLTARMFTATSFDDANSLSSLLMEFYDGSDNKLGTVNAQQATGTQFRWLELDRSPIPSGATYVKLVPILRLGASETSSFLWNDLSLTLMSGNAPPATPSITMTAPSAGWGVTQGNPLALSADAVVPSGGSVRFRIYRGDGTTLIDTVNATQGSGNTWSATWTATSVHKNRTRVIVAEDLDSGGTVVATDGPISGTVYKK